MKIKIAFLYLLFSTGISYSQGQFITTIAGNGTAGFLGDGGPATLGELNYNSGITIDVSGNIYIADNGNNRVRKMNTSGIISTIAGNGTHAFSGDGSAATLASLNQPTNVAIDAAGSIFIADNGNNCIRKVSPAGIITTVAGTGGTHGYGGDGGPATLALLYDPSGIAVDSIGNIYIAESGNSRIRKVNTSGIINTIAGTGTAGYSGDGGPAAAAQLNAPTNIILDATGNIYISDNGNVRIRKINPSGIITTIAGNGTTGFYGDGGGATMAEFYYLAGIAIDMFGNIYIDDSHNNRIRKINASGIISTIAGNGTAGYSGDGCAATAAELKDPFGVAVDASGKIYICDYLNNVVRMVYTTPPPRFIGGTVQSLSVCENATGVSINSLLAVMDSAVGNTATWSVVTAPSHGSAATAFATPTTGATLTPAGLSYTPAGGYRGVDTFAVQVSDCGNAPDTTIIAVRIDTFPVAGVITGPDSVCAGHTVTVADAAVGGAWSATNARAIISGGIVSGVAPGIDTLLYIVTNVCGADTAPHVVSIKDCPNVVNALVGSTENNLLIFPNPNNGTFNIKIPSANTGQAHITITNILGEKVEEWTIETNKETDVILDAPSGIYFVGVVTKDGTYNAKVVVAR